MTIVLLLLFVSPVISTSMGCFQNATFSNLVNGIWFFNASSCHICACRTSATGGVAFNCFVASNSTRHCLIFQNYSTSAGGVQIIANQNRSFGCFFQSPPETSSMTSRFFHHDISKVRTPILLRESF